jgi:hypothetical protein
MPRTLSLGDCTFELLTRGDAFLGLGRITIADRAVRSGRLPLSVVTQTFSGHQSAGCTLLGVDERPDELRIRTRLAFAPMLTQVLRDHSFDPIHDQSDWAEPAAAGSAELDLVLRLTQDTFNGVAARGFQYHWEYRSAETALYWLLDRASWELDGDIAGATVYNQSSCSDPVCTFRDERGWTTEGVIHWDDPNSRANPVMTHNLPRWASHQAFDFQSRGGDVLLGVFARVELIRSVLVRDRGQPELKCFDKHLFDETREHATPAKAILLAPGPRSAVGVQNLWTWVQDEVYARARAEFGLREEPLRLRLAWNFWVNWTIDSYYKDLLPVARAIGIDGLFIDNVNRSDYTDTRPKLEHYGGNMCCGHQYEIAPLVGGPAAMKRFAEECAASGIHIAAWTNNDQSKVSPLFAQHRDWFVRMEDTRLTYGGAYTDCFSIWSFAHDAARRNWVDHLKQTRQETGLGGYLFDSFYNLGFMPMDYSGGRPHTQWRQLLAAFKELQDADVHFMIESFGPFGEVQHGCPASYGLDHLFICYKIQLGTGYTTIPTGQEKPRSEPWPEADWYRILAHMARPGLPLFFQGVRVDKLLTPGHLAAIRDYQTQRPHLARRYLQEDGQGVLWHDAAGQRATLWNFTARTVALPGQVTDVTTGAALPPAARYTLQPQHTYALTGAPLPTQIG